MHRTLKPIDYKPQLSKRRTWYSDPAPDTELPPPDKGGEHKQGGGIGQEEVNRLIGKTRKEARDTARTELLKELGFDNPDDLKALVTDAKARKDAEMSAAEKAQAEAARALKERDDALAKLAQAEQTRLSERREQAVRDAATASGAIDASDIAAWAKEHGGDTFTAVLKDDGSVDKDKVEAVVKAAKTAKPHYFKSVGIGSPPFGGQRPNGDNNKEIAPKGSLFKL